MYTAEMGGGGYFRENTVIMICNYNSTPNGFFTLCYIVCIHLDKLEEACVARCRIYG